MGTFSGRDQDPLPGVVAQAQNEEAAQVQGRNPAVEPGVVLGHASEGHAPVTAGHPGDRAFDHRPVLAVDVLEFRAGGAGAVSAQHRIVRVDLEVASTFAGGASSS